MSQVKHVYRSTPELARAIIAQTALQREFYDTVIKVYAETSDRDTHWLQYTGSVDPECVGFTDTTTEVPSGLSRAQKRDYLIPRKGETGAPWRAIMARMNKRPRIGDVLRKYGVQTLIISGDRCYTPGYFVDTEAELAYFICTAPLESEHLTEIKMSEFYAAREAYDERQQATA